MLAQNKAELDENLSDIIPVSQFIRLHPTLMSLDRFRFYVRRRHDNGLAESGGLVKVGKAHHVKYTEFSQWLYKHINIYGRES